MNRGGQVVKTMLVLRLTTMTAVMVVLVERMVLVSHGDSEKLNVLVCVPWHRCSQGCHLICLCGRGTQGHHVSYMVI